MPAYFALALCASTWPCAAEQGGPPTTAKDVRLTTTTPLGEASVIFPAGSPVSAPVGEEQSIALRQGPFSGVVDREDLVFPAPPAAEPSPVGNETSASLENAANPAPAFSWVDPSAMTAGARWFDDWRILLPTSAAVLFALYSLFATAALVRRRKRNVYED